MKEIISEHFNMEEFIYSTIAIEQGIDNTPPIEAQAAIRNLVNRLLEPLRVYINNPLIISSGYQSEELNRLVRGVPCSQHRKGEAVDIYTFNNPHLLEYLLDSGLDFDQAIWYQKRKFIHLSLKYNGINRHQVLMR